MVRLGVCSGSSSHGDRGTDVFNLTSAVESHSRRGTTPRGRAGSSRPGRWAAHGYMGGAGIRSPPAWTWRVTCASTTGGKRLESSWHGRPASEKEREKHSAPLHRRAAKVLVRSSSDSSYASGSPGGSPSSSGEQQPSGPGARTRTPGTQDPGPLPGALSGPPQDSPPSRENQDDQPPPRLKKSFEIFVRKPTSSKPKPPPRKYFKSDSDPPKSPEEQEDSCPLGPAVPARVQVSGLLGVVGRVQRSPSSWWVSTAGQQGLPASSQGRGRGVPNPGRGQGHPALLQLRVASGQVAVAGAER